MQLTRSYSFLRLCALGLACVANPFLNAGEYVVVQGNPPLTSVMVKKAASFFEWALDVRFTPAQSQEYELILAREWTDDSKRKSALELLQNVDKLAGLPENARRELRQNVQSSMLKSLRKETGDPDSQWMLAVFNAAHQGGPAADAMTPRYAALDPRQVIGKWRATRSASVQYGNAATGALAPANGSSYAYQFNADGTYHFSGLLQVTTYGCHTAIYSDDTGKYHLEAHRITIIPAGGTTRVQQNCGSTGNTEKPADLTPRERLLHLEANSNPPVLVMEAVNGRSKPDYFRAER